MTSSKASVIEPGPAIRTIVCRGVTVRSPMALYDPASPNRIVLLSIYGSPQQTRAMAALIATGVVLTTEDADGATIDLQRPEKLRLRGRAVGYGKHHMLLWDETIKESHVIWMTPAQRVERLTQALGQHKIPYDPAWLSEMEDLLVQGEYLEPLQGWGPASGYVMHLAEDEICTMLVERFGAPIPSRKTASARKRPTEQAA